MEIRPILSTLMRHKTAATLIVLQIAVTCAIICNAFFMIGERITQISEPSGLAEDELVRIQIMPVGDDPEAGPRTRTDLALLRGLPGVTAATVVNQVPFGNSSWNSGVRLTPDQQQSTLNATNYMAEENFIQAFGLNLIAGRDFLPEEYREFEEVRRSEEPIAVPAAIITKALAERLFPGENPIGKVFYSWGDAPIPVVGVIEHLVRPNSVGGPGAREYTMVFPLRTNYDVSGNYLVRTTPERRAEVLAAATEALRGNGPPRIVLEEYSTTVTELRDRFYQQERGMAWLLGIVCVALLLITALGIVGLASFWVQQRTRQIGVRRALGATKRQILSYFQTENFLLATVGIVLGMLMAFGINQMLMESGSQARLPWFYLPIGAVALWLLGQLAVLGPALRAASVPPAVATRNV